MTRKVIRVVDEDREAELQQHARRYRFLCANALVSIDDPDGAAHVARGAENIDALVARLQEDE